MSCGKNEADGKTAVHLFTQDMENAIMYKLQDKLIQYGPALVDVERAIASLDW